MSGPVSSAFTSAVALIIVTSQVKDVLGIHSSGDTFLEMWISLFQQMKHTRLWDTVLGIVCIVVLLIMRVRAATAHKKKKPYLRTNSEVFRGKRTEETVS